MGDITDFLITAKKPAIFVGVGNTGLSDDGAGPELADKIINSRFPSINCGSVPENYLEKITALNAATVILIDATDLKSSPGSYSIIPAHQIANISISTHALSLGMLAKYLRVSCGSELFLLAVQPENLEQGDSLSKRVKTTIEELASKINGYHER